MQLITRFGDFAGIMVYISGHSFVGTSNPSQAGAAEAECGRAGSDPPAKKLGFPWRSCYATSVQAMARR